MYRNINCRRTQSCNIYIKRFEHSNLKNYIHSSANKKLFIIHHTYYQCARDSYLKLNPLCRVKAVNDVVPSNHANETPRDKTVHKCMHVLSSRFSSLKFCVGCDRWWYFCIFNPTNWHAPYS